jgi:hypothetical protein
MPSSYHFLHVSTQIPLFFGSVDPNWFTKVWKKIPEGKIGGRGKEKRKFMVSVTFFGAKFEVKEI